MKTIGDHIRNRRLDLGLPLNKLAKIFEISKPTLISWEHNIKIPRVKKYPKIFEFLGYTVLQIDNGYYSNLFTNYRRAKGMTQTQFSKEINIDQKRIHKIEFEKIHLSEKMKFRIYKFFKNTLKFRAKDF